VIRGLLVLVGLLMCAGAFAGMNELHHQRLTSNTGRRWHRAKANALGAIGGVGALLVVIVILSLAAEV